MSCRSSKEIARNYRKLCAVANQGDLCFRGPKDLVHPLITTFGNLLCSTPSPRQLGLQAHCTLICHMLLRGALLSAGISHDELWFMTNGPFPREKGGVTATLLLELLLKSRSPLFSRLQGLRAVLETEFPECFLRGFPNSKFQCVFRAFPDLNLELPTQRT